MFELVGFEVDPGGFTKGNILGEKQYVWPVGPKCITEVGIEKKEERGW